MNKTPREDLLEDLKDLEFAKLYGAESAKTDFAITLLKARENANLTQKEFATKLGISQPYIARLESGEANPTLGTIGSILATLGLRLVTNTDSLSPERELPAANLAGSAADSEIVNQVEDFLHQGQEKLCVSSTYGYISQKPSEQRYIAAPLSSYDMGERDIIGGAVA